MHRHTPPHPDLPVVAATRSQHGRRTETIRFKVRVRSSQPCFCQGQDTGLFEFMLVSDTRACCYSSDLFRRDCMLARDDKRAKERATDARSRTPHLLPRHPALFSNEVRWCGCIKSWDREVPWPGFHQMESSPHRLQYASNSPFHLNWSEKTIAAGLAMRESCGYVLITAIRYEKVLGELKRVIPTNKQTPLYYPPARRCMHIRPQ